MTHSERLRENGIDETQIQELEENRGDWIERDKSESLPTGTETGSSRTQAGTTQGGDQGWYPAPNSEKFHC